MTSRVRQWVRLIAFTGAAQITVQAIGFISGILVIRLLPIHEYALYTLANTMLGALTILADGGVATGVMSQGGKVWQDKRKLGAILVTGMALRQKLAMFGLLLVVPILFYLLQKHDASTLMSTLIVLSLVPAFFSALSGTLLQIPIKLNQDIKQMQRYQIEANLGRFALLGLTLFVFPYAAIAIVCAGVSQIWNNWRLRHLCAHYSDGHQPVNVEVKRNIIGIVRRTLPGSVYYMLSGQLSIWLLSIYGTSENVAQIGALGRFIAVLTLVSTIFSTLVIPRYSRIPSGDNRLFTKYCLIHASLVPLLIVGVILVWTFSGVALSILGAEYSDLNDEFVLAMAGAMLSIMTDIGISANASRGYVFPPHVYIPFMAVLQVVLVIVLPVDTLMGVLMLNLLFRCVSYVLTFLYGAFRMRGR